MRPRLAYPQNPTVGESVQVKRVHGRIIADSKTVREALKERDRINESHCGANRADSNAVTQREGH